jgi:FlaG/FlaF family flagellin (archaellin)
LFHDPLGSIISLSRGSIGRLLAISAATFMSGGGKEAARRHDEDSMQVTDLFTDDDAVSSVVSTVLMVAITIILVAVIGSFVLDLGGAVDESPPQARLSVVEQQFGSGPSHTSVLINHEGGSTVEESQVEVTVNGNPALDESNTEVWSGSDKITAGDTVNVTKYDDGSPNSRLSQGDRVLVVWESQSGETSTRLFEHIVRT